MSGLIFWDVHPSPAGWDKHNISRSLAAREIRSGLPQIICSLWPTTEKKTTQQISLVDVECVFCSLPLRLDSILFVSRRLIDFKLIDRKARTHTRSIIKSFRLSHSLEFRTKWIITLSSVIFTFGNCRCCEQWNLLFRRQTTGHEFFSFAKQFMAHANYAKQLVKIEIRRFTVVDCAHTPVLFIFVNCKLTHWEECGFWSSSVRILIGLWLENVDTG